MNTDNPILSSTETINPYRYGLNAIYDRLKWDARPESWRSRRRLDALYNKYIGRKAVIVCNGPSLLKTDLQLLQNTLSFGLNKINLLFDRSSYRPNFVVAVNAFVIQQNSDFFNSTDIPLFLASVGLNHVKPRENITFLHSGAQTKFARNCRMSIQEGHTVTYVAMQLAYHMGIRNIALIGCDHNFTRKGHANKVEVADGPDQSHFDPRYFSGGVKWNLPDLSASEYYYALAGQFFSASGGEIVNSTEGGALELFRRIPLKEWVK